MLILVLFFAVVACNSGGEGNELRKNIELNDSVAPAPDIENDKTVQLFSAIDKENNNVELEISSDKVLVSLGSWCPHSSNLLKAMTDSRYSKLFDKNRVILLLDRYEIDNFKKYAASSGDFSAQEIKMASEKLDEIKEYSKIVDPTCMELLSNYTYYYVDYNKYSIENIPGCYIDGSPHDNYMQGLADNFYDKNPILFKDFLNFFKELENK